MVWIGEGYYIISFMSYDLQWMLKDHLVVVSLCKNTYMWRNDHWIWCFCFTIALPVIKDFCLRVCTPECVCWGKGVILFPSEFSQGGWSLDFFSRSCWALVLTPSPSVHISSREPHLVPMTYTPQAMPPQTRQPPPSNHVGKLKLTVSQVHVFVDYKHNFWPYIVLQWNPS